MDTNCFSLKAFRRAMQKAGKRGERLPLACASGLCPWRYGFLSPGFGSGLGLRRNSSSWGNGL
jgi:hypothetical protein